MTVRHQFIVLLTIAFLLAYAGTTAARSVTQSVELMVAASGEDASSLELEIFSMGISDSANTDLSGTLITDLTLDVCGPETFVTRLQFTGGNVSASDFNFRLPRIFPLVRVDASGIGGTLTTQPGAGFVVDGTFATQDHTLLLNQGTLDISGALVQDTTVLLADDPVDFTAMSTGTIELTELSSSGNDFTYGIRAVLPIDATTTTENPDATLTAVGTIIALGEVTVSLATPGDYNNDGQINAADYTVWRDTLGQTGPGLAADGNANNQVDTGDYQIWRNNYGTAAATVAIPEPATLCISLLLLPKLARGRRA